MKDRKTYEECLCAKKQRVMCVWKIENHEECVCVKII